MIEPVDYSPASAAGWLDLDSAASEQVGTLLRSLEEPGTLDPLGFGLVRDAFSGMLSPGTSTIQTRLRYFMFLPWIFSTLEAERVSPGKFADRLRDLEGRLIDCLRHLGPGQGVIGYSAGRDLKRLPSEIYWRGLGSWGLRKLDLGLAEYGGRAAALGRIRLDPEADVGGTSRRIAMWAPGPEPPDRFLDTELSFDLTEEEALLLCDHIRRSHPSSLLAALSTRPELASGTAFPWQVPADALSGHLRTVLHHAQCFSELTVGPQHLYNVLLARDASEELKWDTGAVEARESQHLDAWAYLVTARHAELRDWVEDLPAFWAILPHADSVPPPTKAFIERIVRDAVNDPSSLLTDHGLHGRIREREARLKGPRARLTRRSALENWNQQPFGGQLDYRWPVTRSYLADLTDAIGSIV